MLSANNFASQGPNAADPALVRFARVGRHAAKDFDLVLTLTEGTSVVCPSADASCHAAKAGGYYGQMSFGRGASEALPITFSFTYSDGSGAARLPAVYVSFLDLRVGTSGVPAPVESVAVAGHDSHEMGAGLIARDFTVGGVAGQRFQATSATANLPSAAGTPPTELSSEQSAAAVRVLFRDVTSFRTVFGSVTQAAGCCERILFAGEGIASDPF